MEERSHSQPPPPKKSSPTPKKTRGIDEHEAVRRGLSFGPIKSQEQRSFTRGVLKSTAGSPPPESRRRGRSGSSEQDSTRNSEESKRDGDRRSPRSGSKSGGESSEDEETWSSGDEATEPRGRKKESKHGLIQGESGLPNEGSSRRALSLDSQPSITVTEPEGEKPNDKKTSSKTFTVHPNTNFDRPGSKPETGVRAASPTRSENEETTAIARALSLPIFCSDLDSSVQHRAIQTLVRGDFTLFQREATEGQRRIRTYLAATDLSGEAAYALEWTIGTVLRDGDTLFAIYAVDEEVGTGAEKEAGIPRGQGAAAMQETKAKVDIMTAETQKKSLMSFSPLPKSVLRPSSRKSSAATSTDSRVLSLAQQERLHALNKLQETCIGLLKKTVLQCRIVIEVIHCNSPKYMITEAVGLVLSIICSG